MDYRNDGVSIHAGFPNPASDTTIRGFNLNTLLVWHSASTFLMRVTGDDWSEQGIYSGDIAIIDRALAPKALDKVIWLHDDSFAISELVLVPKQAAIWGVVTAIIHRYRKLS